MENIQIDSPLNDIPRPSKNIYLEQLIFKISEFTHRVRWKASTVIGSIN